MSAPGLMDFLNSILVDGKKLDFDEEGVEKAYCPHPVNRGIAQNIDTVMFAQELNKRPWLDKELQYRFLLGSIAKKKRYGKWAKKQESENQDDIEILMHVYEISEDKAREYLEILTEEEMEAHRKMVFKGGADKVKGLKK